MRPYFLIYASHATRDWTDQELFDLLSTSRLRNAHMGITGLLVYAQRRFLQILEGEQSQVLQLYELIKHNPGHKNAMVLLDDQQDERIFPDWSMGFERLEDDDLSLMSGYRNIDQFIESLTNPHPVFTFLKLFHKKNFQKREEA